MACFWAAKTAWARTIGDAKLLDIAVASVVTATEYWNENDISEIDSNYN